MHNVPVTCFAQEVCPFLEVEDVERLAAAVPPTGAAILDSPALRVGVRVNFLPSALQERFALKASFLSAASCGTDVAFELLTSASQTVREAELNLFASLSRATQFEQRDGESSAPGGPASRFFSPRTGPATAAQGAPPQEAPAQSPRSALLPYPTFDRFTQFCAHSGCHSVLYDGTLFPELRVLKLRWNASLILLATLQKRWEKRFAQGARRRASLSFVPRLRTLRLLVTPLDRQVDGAAIRRFFENLAHPLDELAIYCPTTAEDVAFWDSCVAALSVKCRLFRYSALRLAHLQRRAINLTRFQLLQVPCDSLEQILEILKTLDKSVGGEKIRLVVHQLVLTLPVRVCDISELRRALHDALPRIARVRVLRLNFPLYDGARGATGEHATVAGVIDNLEKTKYDPEAAASGGAVIEDDDCRLEERSFSKCTDREAERLGSPGRRAAHALLRVRRAVGGPIGIPLEADSAFASCRVEISGFHPTLYKAHNVLLHLISLKPRMKPTRFVPKRRLLLFFCKCSGVAAQEEAALWSDVAKSFASHPDFQHPFFIGGEYYEAKQLDAIQAAFDRFCPQGRMRMFDTPFT